MSYKIKKVYGRKIWDGIPDNVKFYDKKSPTFQDFTNEEFNGFIKGLNIVDSYTNHYSSDSEEYRKYEEEFMVLIPKHKRINSVWFGGVLVGFNESYFDHYDEESEK